MIKINPYIKQRREELELMAREESNSQLRVAMKIMIEVDDLKIAVKQIQERLKN